MLDDARDIPEMMTRIVTVRGNHVSCSERPAIGVVEGKPTLLDAFRSIYPRRHRPFERYPGDPPADLFISTGDGEKVVVVTCQLAAVSAQACLESLRPDPQVVGDVADVSLRRPGEGRVCR
jgi:hypothetical protein